MTFNQVVVGSSPTALTTLSQPLLAFPRRHRFPKTSLREASGKQTGYLSPPSQTGVFFGHCGRVIGLIQPWIMTDGPRRSPVWKWLVTAAVLLVGLVLITGVLVTIVLYVRLSGPP